MVFFSIDFFRMRRCFHIIGVAAIALPFFGGVAKAGEYAVLTTGYRLYADRHEASGSRVRLISAGGITELPEALVVGYEAEPIGTNEPEPQVAPTEVIAQPVTVQPVTAPAPVTPQSLAADAAHKFSLPEAFVRSVIQVESAFRPEAISPKGAIGLMQLMPGTARDLGVDPHDPKQNTEGGTAYLRSLLGRYENEPNQVQLALAAYNAGPAAVERYHGVPPYPETRQYIVRVLEAWGAAEPAAK